MSKIHELKCWPEFFDAIDRGEKTFEVRRDDRAFQVGDVLVLCRWRPDNSSTSGHYLTRGDVEGWDGCAKIHVRVTYKLHGGNYGIEWGYCALGIIRIDEA